MQRSKLYLALSFACLSAQTLGDTQNQEEVIVTAPALAAPLTVAIDAKAPQQPMPANDGAAFLKTTPGFNVIRKGGTSGDPVFRGQAASRLNLVMDGMAFGGGCGNRMDPPTAYIFPESYDTVTIIKGPQTVAHGAGHSAGVVLFENTTKPAEGFSGDLSLLSSAWNRTDALADVHWGNAQGFVDLSASHAESDDYQDGAGNEVHSAYERRSGSVRVGYTPTPLTELSIDYTQSEAEASYADRGMDGAVFDRESYGITARHKGISEHLKSAEVRAYHTYIDHVMDNYSLRDKAPMMGYMVSNPDRSTDGVNLTLEWHVTDARSLTTGLVWQSDEHSNRSMMGMTKAMADTYTSKPRLVDLSTESVGVFAELEQQLGDQTRWISGLRVDDWEADRLGLATPVSASETVTAAFTRFEYDLADDSVTTYFGIGYTERPMDYWEAVSAAGLSATAQLKPEATTQVDLGFLWRQGHWNGSVSAFYGLVDDYILIYSGMMPSPRLNNCASGMMSVSCSGNINAERYGFEADVQGQLSDTLSVKANMAWVRAHNDTHDRALAQTPPLDLTISLEHKGKAWTSGLVARYIGEQDRIDRGYGTIVGQDIGATGEATILSVHSSTNLTKDIRLALGLDNIADTDYAEHLSRAGSAVEGYPAIDKVSEPGRTWWAKLSYSF